MRKDEAGKAVSCVPDPLKPKVSERLTSMTLLYFFSASLFPRVNFVENKLPT